MAQHHNMFHPSTRITNAEINKILEQYDGFIQYMARKNVPRNIILSGEIATEIDDLAQNIRLKLWQALQKREIHNVKSYIRAIAYNEGINIVRLQEPTMRIITNEEGELPQACALVAAGQEVYDPTQNIEVEEMLGSYKSNLTENVVKLPKQQQRAMINSLKDQIADMLPLVDMFLPHGIDVESLAWPEAENELRSSRVSLSVARKKLRISMKGED